MNDINLTDLDELAQQVKDKRSRTYIVEAINAYRGGAYRAAIVATWIAVIYDILLKLRELVKREIFQLTAEDLEKLKATKLKKGKDFPSTTVDELKALEDREFNNKNKFWQAVESCTSKPVTDECKGHILERAAPISIFLEEVETYIKEERIFKIEKDILPKAYEVFKLLTLHEYKDLERLREDRHQCAHPAFVAEETLFQPTPERVRMHIVYAVYHLLRYEPVRGEMAINQILHDIKQPSTFPTKYNDVLKFLNDRYFDSVKDDNFIPRLTIILLNKLLRNDDPELWGKEHSLILTLKFISQKYDNIYKKVITDELTSIVRSLEEEQLMRVFYLLKAEQSCWYHLSEAERIRIKRLIEQKTKESNAANFFFNYKLDCCIFLL